MFESGGGDLILKVGQEHIQHQVEAHLHQRMRDAEPPVPLPFITHYVAGALLSTILWWVQGDAPFDAAQMDAMFQALTMQGIKNFLTANGRE